jgi:hypothetical protein
MLPGSLTACRRLEGLHAAEHGPGTRPLSPLPYTERNQMKASAAPPTKPAAA